METTHIRLLPLAIAIFLMLACDSSTKPPTPGPRPTEEDDTEIPDLMYDYVRDYQLKFIRSLQLPSGAIPDNTQPGSKITPYFANSAVLALVRNPSAENEKVVKSYISWYLDHLNGDTNPATGDKEVQGSIYDYYLPGETTKGTYDSVDSYAATFLVIVNEFADSSSENMTWLKDKTNLLDLVASALLDVTDTEDSTMPGVFGKDTDDYLSIAHRGYDVKYLMDNCEVHAGMIAAAGLKEKGLLTRKEDFIALAAKNAAGIEKELWNGNVYRWHAGQTAKTNWGTFYPDATAQLFPGLFGVVEPGSQRAKSMYAEFNRHYSSWQEGIMYDAFPWALICYAAATINDVSRTGKYVQYIYSLNSQGRQMKNWYDAEAGSLVLAIHRIKNPITEEYKN